MALPLIMAGVTMAGSASNVISARRAKKRQEKAVRRQTADLETAWSYNRELLLSQAEDVSAVAGADIRTRLLQARREAGRAASISEAAGASGPTAGAVIESAFGRAGGDIEAITSQSQRARRSIFQDITTSRLTLNQQIRAMKYNLPQSPNPWLGALSIGSSAIGAYARYGGTFGTQGAPETKVS
jgi:hypothetical protein